MPLILLSALWAIFFFGLLQLMSQRRHSFPNALLAISLGSFWCLPAFGYGMYFLDIAGVADAPRWSIWVSVALASVGLACMWMCSSYIFALPACAYKQFSVDFHAGNFFKSIAAAGFLVLIVLLAFKFGSIPATSYDLLGSWAQHAREFLRLNVESTSPGVFSHDMRHPTTVVLINAGVAYLMPGNGNAWLLPYASIIMGALSLGASLGVRSIPIIGITYVAFTVPLLVNHSQLFGYADIFTAACYSVSVLVAMIGLRRRSRGLLFFSLIIAFNLVVLKNSGWMLFLGYIFILSATMVQLRFGFKAVTVLITGIFILLITLYSSGFYIDVFGRQIYWDPSRDALRAAGYSMIVGSNGLFEVLWNHFFALAVNATYSVLGVSVLLCLSLGGAVGLFKGNSVSVAFVLLSVLMPLILLTASQHFFSLPFSYSEPDRDTGGSRFLLTPMITSIYFFVLALSKLEPNTPPDQDGVKDSL